MHCFLFKGSRPSRYPDRPSSSFDQSDPGMSSLQLAHRLVHPQNLDTHFTAAAHWSGDSPRVLLDNRDSFLSLADVDLSNDNSIYQLALIPVDGNPQRASVATVKAVRPSFSFFSSLYLTKQKCHLPFSSSADLTIHLDSSHSPYALSFYVDGAPPSGACPSRKALKAFTASELNPLQNTTVRVARPSHPPLSVLLCTICYR